VAPSDEVVARINCGGFDATDTSAQIWEGDKYATAGLPHRYYMPSIFAFFSKSDADSPILKSYRWSPRFWFGSAGITYEIPVSKGDVYAVELLFPDHFSIWDFFFSFFNILKSRLYSVYIEDVLILEDIEIKSNAMSPANTVRVNTKGIQAIDGSLSVRIVSKTKSPSIAGIVVYDVTPGLIPGTEDVPTVAMGNNTPSDIPLEVPSAAPKEELATVLPTIGSAPVSPPSSSSNEIPSSKPSSVLTLPPPSPSEIPTSKPSSIPTSLPSSSPSEIPSSNPSSGAPIYFPSMIPLPTVSPTWAGSPTPCHFESKKLASTYDGHRIFLDEFGKVVAVHGNTVVVGAPQGNNENGADSGSIYVYTLDSANGQVTLQDKFTGSDTRQEERFGGLLAIHGDTIIAGRRTGTVYIFVRENDTWIEQAKLPIGNGSLSLDIHGDTIVLGSSGLVRVFVRDVSQQWSLQATLQAEDTSANVAFGSSVAISENTAVVGAPRDYDNGPSSGSVYIFVRDENGLWTQDAKLLKSGGSSGDYFGTAVAIDAETIVVGAKSDDQRGTNAGAAVVYSLGLTGDWVEEAKLLAYDAGSYDYFASAVAIDGDMIAVGVALDDDNAHSTGSVYLFKRNQSDEWSQHLKLLASDGASHDKFGRALGVSNGTVVVGAYWNIATNSERTGAAYVYSSAAEPTLCRVSTSKTVSFEPTFVVSDAPYFRPTSAPPLEMSDFPVGSPCDYGCYDISENIYIAYSALNVTEQPTVTEYRQMESLTLDFLRSYLALVVNGGSIDITFRSWQYEASIPEDKFNLYLELSSFAGKCGCELNEFQVSRDVLGVYMEEYQAIYVTSVIDTDEIVYGEWYE